MNLIKLVKIVVSSSILSKLINSVIMVGLYYGFLSALALKTSYILLIRALVRENKNHKAAAITGFILGQLGQLLSIYYAPLYIAFGRPYTLTVLTLIYFLVNLFGNNLDQNASSFGAYGNTICIFLNNLILQLLNTCIFPSSTLARVVNVYLFRCNNKMVFLISSFSAWLIGQILILRCCQLVVGRGQNKNSIRALIQKYLVRNSMFFLVVNCLFGSSLFILTIQSLGRIPLPIPTQPLSETSRIEKREQERLNKSGVAKEENATEDQTDLSHEKDSLKKEPYSKLEDEDEDIEKGIEQAIGTLLFDYKRWARPVRYIKNNQLEQAVRNENSQYLFATHRSDGKLRICFTHPINLSMFWKNISYLSRTKNYSNKLNRRWVEQNKKKLGSFKRDLLNRIKNVDKILRVEFATTKNQLCIHDEETKQKYVPEEYDPLLSGAYRGRIKNEQEEILQKRENKTSADPLDTSIEVLEKNHNAQLVEANPIVKKKKGFEDEFIKKVPRWSYKLITEIEQIAYFRNPPDDHDIRTRKAKSLVVFDPSKYPYLETMEDSINDSNTKTTNLQNNLKNPKITTSENDPDNNTTEEEPKDDKSYSLRYSHQSDFRHGLIKDSMRSLRRKIVIGNIFQGNINSPLFFERRKKTHLFSLSGLVKLKRFFRRWSTIKERQHFNYIEKKRKIKDDKKKEKRERIEIGEAWDSFELTQTLRGCLLITQSNLRKNIVLPLLIIIKNVGRVILFQTSEWSEDFEELEKETHVPCTYNGIPLGENEFPRNWLTEGIQIKIILPFCLKPWNEDKKPLPESENFCFLTIWGHETDYIFGRPRKKPSFFKPILEKLDTNFRKINVVQVSKEKRTAEPDIVMDDLRNNILDQPLNLFQFSHCEKLQAITNRTSLIQTELQKITEEKKKVTQDLALNFSKKNLKRKKFKLILNLNYFLKILFQKIYTFFLFTIQFISRLINQTIYEVREKLIDQSCSKNEKNTRVYNILNYIFNKKKQQKLRTFTNFSDLSQAYVFYKISQQKTSFNVCKLRSIFNKQGTTVYIKPEIKEYFAKQGLIQTSEKTTKSRQLKTHQWKNWLRINSQYNLSGILWSSFSAKKKNWRKKINRGPKLNKKPCNYSGNSNFNHSKKQNSNYVILNKQQKENFEKCYQYDVLASKFINFKNKNAACIDRSTISLTKQNHISYHKIMSQNFLFALTNNMWVKNLIGKIERINIPYIEKDLDRKYLSFENIQFSPKNKLNIESWIPLTSRGYPLKNYKYELLDELELMELIDQIFKKEKELLFPCFEQNNKKGNSKSKNSLIDWMGLNEKFLNHPLTALDLWFFPEFVSRINIYKLKPWILQSELLLSKLTFNKLTKQQKKTTTKINVETKNKKNEKAKTGENKGTKNQQNGEIKTKQDSKTKNEENKEIKTKQKKENEEDPQLAYIKSFLKKHLLFQLRGEPLLKTSGFKNIQILCRLLRLLDENELLLSSIQRQRLNLFIMPEIGIKDVTLEALEYMGVPEFLNEKSINFESVPLSINKNGKFLMYKLLNISLVHKIKYPTKNESQNNRLVTTKNNNNIASIIPETILSSKRRRELRILMCLNYNKNKYQSTEDTKPFFYNKNCTKILENQKNTIEFFIWPNSRFEDLTCMNRYWFYTNNGSRFSMLRIFMYLPLKNL